MADRVVVHSYYNANSAEAADDLLEQAVADGAELVFTTTPRLNRATLKAAVRHPKIRFFNCSVNVPYSSVRSYYCRIFEGKFITGAIAGAMADNDHIGYIGSYPIYGVPASINAFALGAQMTNPRATIYLKWSSIPDSCPADELEAIGVDIISNRDISAPRMESREFGLYHKKDGVVSNLAMPMWNWDKLYEGIARSILSGAWDDDSSSNADRALSYFMGMSTDAIDLLCSKRIPPRVRRLVDLLHERIRCGEFLPFIGPIVDQSGVTRVEADVALTPQEIIRMDYLAQNVIGRIPDIHELTDVAKALVSMQGVRTGESKKTGEPV